MAAFNEETVAGDDAFDLVMADLGIEGVQFDDEGNFLNGTISGLKTLGKIVGQIAGLYDALGSPSTRRGFNRFMGAVKTLSGTWSWTGGNPLLTGSGGNATNELNVNEYIVGPGNIPRKIQSIGGINSITLYKAFATNSTSVAITRIPTLSERLDVNVSGAYLVLSGMTLSNDGTTPNTVLDVAAGFAEDDTGVAIIKLSAFTGSIAGTWVVGSGNNKLDTGAVAASTTYHIFAISKPNGVSPDILFSTSLASPTFPSGYTLKRRIGSLYTDASSHWVLFTQVGNYFMRTTPSIDVNATNPGTAAVTRTLSVPTGLVMFADLNVILNEGGTANTSAYISALAQTDSAATTATPAIASVIGPGAGSGVAAVIMSVMTNASAQIRSRNQTSGGGEILQIYTRGWKDLQLK